MEEDPKPQVTKDDVNGIVEKTYGLIAASVVELNSYDDRNFLINVSRCVNPNMDELCTDGYILKIINANDSKNLAFFEAQDDILQRLRERNISAPIPQKNLAGSLISYELLPFAGGQRKHIVKLFDYKPGKILKGVACDYELYYQVGAVAALLDNALQDCRNPVLEKHKMMWHLKSAGDVKDYLKFVKDDSRRSMVRRVLNDFAEKIAPIMAELPSGVIHGDLNEQNILVTKSVNGNWEIGAILDFGDVNYACYLFEIASAMVYMMLDSLRCGLDPIECGRHTLAGYQITRPLSKREHSLLKLAVCTRLCQSLVLGLYSMSQQPGNQQYVGDTQISGWTVLKLLCDTPDEELKWPCVH